MQVAEQLLGRNAATHEHDGVHELVLILVVGGLARVEAGNVYDLRVGNGAELADRLVEQGYLALPLLAGVRDERDVASQAEHHERAKVRKRPRRDCARHNGEIPPKGPQKFGFTRKTHKKEIPPPRFFVQMTENYLQFRKDFVIIGPPKAIPAGGLFPRLSNSL